MHLFFIYLFIVFFFLGGGGDGRLFEAGRLLTFPTYRVGAYSRWALIRGWAPNRINTVLGKKEIPRGPNRSRTYDLSICTSDALRLSYRRLVVARSLN